MLEEAKNTLMKVSYIFRLCFVFCADPQGFGSNPTCAAAVTTANAAAFSIFLRLACPFKLLEFLMTDERSLSIYTSIPLPLGPIPPFLPS